MEKAKRQTLVSAQGEGTAFVQPALLAAEMSRLFPAILLKMA
jgi:hypothetical protein